LRIDRCAGRILRRRGFARHIHGLIRTGRSGTCARTIFFRVGSRFFFVFHLLFRIIDPTGPRHSRLSLAVLRWRRDCILIKRQSITLENPD
jgi:hypothetical protein